MVGPEPSVTERSGDPAGPVAPYRDFAVPSAVEQHSRGWLALPEAERPVASPRAAVTVMLLRGSGAGAEVAAPEVFALRRVRGMAFAGGMVAFPGGGVDPRDADLKVPWAGPPPERWSEVLGQDVPAARALVTAAAREVFEECGVLLAGPSAQEVVADPTGPDWARERALLLDRSQSFAELLRRRSLVLRADLLGFRGRWITPTCEPRRYDTWFLAARMPEGQVADDDTSEAEEARWWRPSELLEAQRAEREVLLPPTQVMVEQVSRITDLDGWLAEEVTHEPVVPWPVEHDDRVWMRCAVDADGREVAS